MQGPGSKLSELVPAGMPVFPLEGGPHELQAIGGKFTYLAGTAFTPTATFAAHIQLRNPPGSGKLVTVATLRPVASTGQLLRVLLVPGSAALTAVTTGFAARDSRVGTAASAILETTDAAVSVGGENYEMTISAETMIDGWTLAPGSLLFVEKNVANTRLTVTFGWSERRLEPSELSI